MNSQNEQPPTPTTLPKPRRKRPSGTAALHACGKTPISIAVENELVRLIDQAAAIDYRCRADFVTFYGLPAVVAAAQRVIATAAAASKAKTEATQP